MKMPFSRRAAPVPIPAGVTESWSAEENMVLVTLPFLDDGRDASAAADRLSEEIVATVNAVQAGEFGHSLPEGAAGAGVRIVVDTGVVPLGPLAARRVEILQERLGVSIPLSVTTAEAPPEPEAPEASGDEAVVAEAPAPVTLTKVEPAAPAPSPGLEAPPYLWDEENQRLRAEIIYLGVSVDIVASDAQTQVDLQRLVELTLAALATPATQALVPVDAPAGYPIWMTIAVNDDAVGPLTEALFESGEDQFEGTRVDFAVLTEPRETIVEMLAQR